MTRQAKTPKQRAQEQLDTARRIEKRLAKRRDVLRSDLTDVTAEHDAAVARVEYLAKHPDLQPTTPTPGGTTA